MRVLTAFGVVLLAVAVVAADALLVYRDENLHSDERLIAKAREAGFAEKQLQANGRCRQLRGRPNNGLRFCSSTAKAWSGKTRESAAEARRELPRVRG